MEKTANVLTRPDVSALRSAARPPVAPPSTADPPATGQVNTAGVQQNTDRVTISDRAQQLSAAQTGAAASVTGAPASDAERAVLEIRDRFFTTAGDRNFSEDFDFNRDGVINFEDLGQLQEKLASANGATLSAATPPSPSPVPDSPEQGVVSGTNNTQPLTQAEPVSVGSADAEPALTLDGLRESFFARAGDDRFNAAADLNRDGVVNATDLGLFRQAQADTAEPVQPVPDVVETVGSVDSADTAAVNAQSTDAEPAATVETNVPTQAVDAASDRATIRANLVDQLRSALVDARDRSEGRANAGQLDLTDYLSVNEEV
ncbi:MAG: hypothetical protein AAF610_13350 [Pseudomonadota bacterium]